jgi:putative hydrolase of the HAD superfamily
MILIFDLDDTIYNEKEFIFNGYKAVANFFYKKIKIYKKKYIFEYLKYQYLLKGREKIFDKFLMKFGIFNKKNLNLCIKLYRYNNFKLFFKTSFKKIFKKYNKKIYLVTDGNWLVQKNKVRNLKINNFFKKIFYTGFYGPRYFKPSLMCFIKIKELEGCNWSDLLYIGDNPFKDFVLIKQKGIKTVRVLNGRYKNVKVDRKYDAEYSIKSINELIPLLKKNANF